MFRWFVGLSTILARRENGYDRSWIRLGEMVSHRDGSILPEVQHGSGQSPEWQAYQHTLRAVADAPAGLRKDESRLNQAEWRVADVVPEAIFAITAFEPRNSHKQRGLRH